MAEFDISSPQRQSVRGILVMQLYMMQQFIRTNWILFIILFANSSGDKLLKKILIFFGIIMAYLLVVSFLKYRNFKFSFDYHKAEFTLKSGIFSLKTTVLKTQNIQQVTINQSAIQRLIGVYSLDIDTAGTSESEVSIPAINKPLAEYIKAQLLESASRVEKEKLVEEQVHEEQKIFELPLVKLIYSGITSRYTSSVIIVIGFVISLFFRWEEVQDIEVISNYDFQKLLDKILAPIAIVIGLVLGFLLLILFNLGRTILRYYGFTIFQKKDKLSMKFGLVARKNILFVAGKIQHFAFEQNYFQRKLGIYDVKIVKANHMGEGTAVYIPGCSEETKDMLQEKLLPFVNQCERSVVFSPHLKLYAIRLFMFFAIIPALIISIYAMLFSSFDKFVGLLVMTIFIVVGIWCRMYSKKMRYHFYENHLMIKKNIWDIEHLIIENYKIHSVMVKQPFFLKNKGLVDVILSTGGGVVSLRFLPQSQIQFWVDKWLMEVEESTKSWM